jgi:hypothetical protein
MKKNKIKEGALSQGIQSYDTSSSTTPTSSSSKKGEPIYVKAKDLSKSDVKTALKQIDRPVQVVETNNVLKPSKFNYLYVSEVKDATSGEISKPFTIAGKNYKMCRALDPENKIVLGVYSLDEVDENGAHKIYGIDEFEPLAKKSMEEVEKPMVSMPEQKDYSFEGYKHFIVNPEKRKIRKFKSVEELAKATMEEGEQYMGLQSFKKYIDEALFGKRKLKEQQPVGQAAPAPATGQQPQQTQGQKEPPAVTTMMKRVDKALPTTVYNDIKQNPAAQSFAIMDWIKRIGVPSNRANEIINFIRKSAEAQKKQPTPVTENRVIKVIKIKDIK